jgi:hypothetical protein
MDNQKDMEFVRKHRDRALKRLQKSASGYVLVKRFSSAGRAGMKELIAEGKVEFKDTLFGSAYSLKTK